MASPGIPPDKVFFALLVAEGVPLPEREYRFHPTRKWRMDFAWPAQKVALEVEGGLWAAGGGRHNRGLSMIADMYKYNAAAEAGWRVLKAVPDGRRNDGEKPYLCSAYTITLLKAILANNG